MRKIIYSEWVHGTNCYIEKEGLFHGFFPSSMKNNDGSFGNCTDALIETENGRIVSVDPSFIRFVDSPEIDQLAEFAKAAMQGLLSNTEIINHFDGGHVLWISKNAVFQAKSMIAELNKQKP